MRYGRSLYGVYLYNDSVQGATGIVDVNAIINVTNRLLNVQASSTVYSSSVVTFHATCFVAVSGLVTVSDAIDYQRIRNILTVAQVICSGSSYTTAICSSSVNEVVDVFGSSNSVANFIIKGKTIILVSSIIVSRATCFVKSSANISANATVYRTRCKYAKFGYGIQIRAAYNEGIKITSSGTISPKSGTLEWLVYTFNTTSAVERYLFDGAGVTNRNLTVSITADNKVKVSYGTGTNTITLASTIALPRDGATWICVGWDDKGLTVHIDAQQVINSSTAPSLQFGTYIYVGNNSSNTNSLDGLLDEFRISSRKRTTDELVEIKEAFMPLKWDIDTTYLLHFDENINLPDVKKGVWQSPIIDVSNAKDLSSGRVYIESETSGGSSVIVQTRSAHYSSGPWSEWVDVSSDYAFLHNPDNYMQIRLILSSFNDSNIPKVNNMKISFDAASAVELLNSDMSSSEQFYFSSLMDKVIIVNGIDAPHVYDGESILVLPGNPPYCKYVVTHKNRIFMAGTNANPSRIYFSDILNIESWPVLNFIDISPDDGDIITGLMVYSDYLIITKRYSIWILSGDGPNTFTVKRIHSNHGVCAPRSLILADNMISFVSDDGVYFSNLSEYSLISMRIKGLWDELNLRRINQAASWFNDNKLYIAVPSAGSIYNDRVILYDNIRKSFAGVINGWNVSCWSSFIDSNRTITLFGHSDKGQVSEINVGYSDNGQPINFLWKSKEFDFDSPEAYKRWNKIYIDVKPAQYNADLTLTFFVDGKQVGSTTITIPAATAENAIYSVLVLASKANVVGGRRLAIQLQQAVIDNPVGIHKLSIEYLIQGVQPTLYV